MKRSKGFTLIEIMVVVAIIGILSVIAIQLYEGYSIKSANRSCMAEVRHYVTSAMISLNAAEIPLPAVESACLSIETATDMNTPVTAVPKPPGTGGISCDIPTTSCVLTN
jgi:type IV pilus assembly protein PilA